MSRVPPLIVVCAGAMAVSLCAGCDRTLPAGGAPGSDVTRTSLEPLFPSYLKEPSSVDDLMPKARAFVAITRGAQGYGLGNFEPGQTVLIVPDVTAEAMSLEAVRRALNERGVRAIIRTEVEMVGLTREDAEAYRA